MSRRTIRAREVDLLIARTLAAGLVVEAIEITPEGALRVLTQRPTQSGAALPDDNWVDLAGLPPEG